MECKERQGLPDWFMGAWEQAKYNCPEGKVPILQWHILNTNYLESDIVVISLKTFKDWLDRGLEKLISNEEE